MVFRNNFFRSFLAISLICQVTAACVGSGPNGQMTALDKSINECAGSLLIGTALGALAGAAINHKAGQGALYGAGAGGVMCAVFLAMNNAQDKARVRQSEIAAATSGNATTDQYVGNDGATRVIKTSVQSVSPPVNLASNAGPNGEQFVGPCRRTQTNISVQGQGQASLDPEVVCRTAQGDWLPWTGSTTSA